MTGILKSKVSSYEFGLDDIKELIARDLSVPTECVSVDYVIEEVGGDPMDRFLGVDKVTKIRVSVTNKG
jgi:hypothetical protein